MPAVKKGLIFNTAPYMHSKNCPVKLRSKNCPVKLRRNIKRKKQKGVKMFFVCLGLKCLEKKIGGYEKIILNKNKKLSLNFI